MQDNMLGIDRVFFSLALVTTVAAGCGGDADTAGSGGSGQGATTSSVSSTSSSSSSSSGGSDVETSCPTREGTVLAITALHFGEGNSGEWKKVGFNLDDRVSNAASNDVCTPNADGLPATAYPDGDDGIDNSFGKNLLPTILSLYPTWTTDANNGIRNGVFTALLKMYCLPPTGDVPALVTTLVGGTSLGTRPKLDGTDKWPVEPGLLSDPMDPESSTIAFENSSVTGTTFDSGKNVTIILTIPLKTRTASTSIKLTLRAARMTMTLAADRKSATGGMIGGVLNTEEFVTELKKVGYLLNLCGSDVFDNMVTQIRQASDIMTDGSQDPNQTCDGITMGLGFEMTEAQLGDVGAANPVGMVCP
ncbi:hypothetical protein BE17_12670 [Sorangium cellulosum]|uniref:Uncharacterized protein n=1 Tax=Sorangium cellulosum TaxID=56 RepID=A0A150RXW3_SORCE|nr:hypothetical protein BE17_12670 [Sorangium cellulosum]